MDLKDNKPLLEAATLLELVISRSSKRGQLRINARLPFAKSFLLPN